MVVVELKLFISIILPLATILFIVKGDSRKIVAFLLFGIIAELASNFMQNYLYMFVVDDLYFTTNIGPAIEEILKALPVLIFIFALKPEKQLIYEVSIASGIGFAILENVFIIGADIYSTSLVIAFLRGIGAGMMHAVCTLAVGYGMSFIYKKRWFFIPGTFLFMFMAMVYHSIFNTLVQSKYQVIGLCIPIVTFIPLIIRIIGNNPDRDANKRFLKSITAEKLPKKYKRIISAVAIVAIVSVGFASYVRSDGDRLTGGKNGIYGLDNSGINVDPLVQAALASQQDEYDEIYAKLADKEWEKEAYANLYEEIEKFADNITDYKTPGSFDSDDINIVAHTVDSFVRDYWNMYSTLEMFNRSEVLEANQAVEGMMNNMREVANNVILSIDSKYNNLKSIGIIDNRGLLKVELDILDKALKDDPLAAYRIFCADGDGVLDSLYKVTINAMKYLKSYAGTNAEADDDSVLGQEILKLKDKRDRIQELMNEREEGLEGKYEDLENKLRELQKSFGLDSGSPE